MVTGARVRKGALELPEVEERVERDGGAGFHVRGTGVASLSPDGARARFSLPAEAADDVLAEHPEAEAVVRRGSVVGVTLPVAGLDVRVLDRLLHQAWEAQAPKRLVAARRADSPAGRASDLPRIGNPATRALAQQGITTLDQVAEHTEAELLDLHGVGPRAIRILSEALEARGRAFRRG